MSEENVEIVRHSVEAINRGDVEAALSYTDPDGELYSAIVGGAEGNVYRGHDGFRRWYAGGGRAPARGNGSYGIGRRRRRTARPLSTSERAEIGEPLAAPFGHTMIWSLGMSLLALGAALVLLRAERASRSLGKPARAENGQFRTGSPQTGRA
jgi:hypothetical protein